MSKLKIESTPNEGDNFVFLSIQQGSKCRIGQNTDIYRLIQYLKESKLCFPNLILHSNNFILITKISRKLLN